MAKQSVMMRSTTTALGVQDLFAISSTQKLPLGTKVSLADGRSFVYGRAGASDLAYGKMNQTAAPLATSNDEVVASSAAVGDTSISVTFGAAVTANQYADGYLYVNDDTGEGQLYTIKSHPAGTSAVKVTLNEEIRVAVTAGAGTVSAIVHPMAAVIVAPTTLTGTPCGVAVVTVTANYYAWFQVTGACPVLTNGIIVIGNTVEASGTTAGAVDATTETTFKAPLGTVLAVNASTEYSLINLAIPGF